MTTPKLKRGVIAAVSLACCSSLAMMAAVAEAQKRPTSTAASASAKKPDRQRAPGKLAGSTEGSAAANSARPDTNRNRVGYILTNPRKVSFKLPTRTDRTAASALRRDGRGNQVTRIGMATVDKRSGTKSRALASKQAKRGKPRVDPTSTAGLRRAAANRFRPTTSSRVATIARAAPIGSGRVQDPDRQWGALAAETAKRKGLEPPKEGIFQRVIKKAKSLFSR